MVLVAADDPAIETPRRLDPKGHLRDRVWRWSVELGPTESASLAGLAAAESAAAAPATNLDEEDCQ
ncbi:MAG TPA: hypothetical protein VF444_04540 [Pseudonocardiaceae bacterium]